MSDLVTSLVREFVQKAVGVVALWLAAHGMNLPKSVTDWATLTAIGAGLWVWTAILRYLETRPPSSASGRFANWLARILMLGVTAKPSYQLSKTTTAA